MNGFEPLFATPEAVAAMMKYNDSLQQAGVLLALNGLHPPSMGARVSFQGGKPTVQDGPFAEAKEVLGGYYLVEAGAGVITSVRFARTAAIISGLPL